MAVSTPNIKISSTWKEIDTQKKYNEGEGSYKINLKSSQIHLASRGFKDSIGDVEYSQGKMRIGLRANGIPVNIFVDLI
jgi:hypothetical protein